ncbi:MAG TPA: hypothetical protein VHO29_04095 [Marmoricola sp.]|nr:hypothetical protein [Marmoricola sp.]
MMKFRRGVYAARRRLTPGCQLLLLRLSDSMDTKAIVSVPRSTLAEDLDCPPSRVSEWVAEAKAAGFLSVVRRARPQVTAVYQGLYVVPERYAPADLRGTPPVSSQEVRPPVPLNGPQRYAQHPTQENKTQPSEQTNVHHLVQRGNEGESA